MAIPSGSGTEIISRGWAHACTAADYTYFNFANAISTNTSVAVPANHIVTLLNIIVCDQSNSTGKTFSIIYNDGTNGVNIVASQALESYGTFVFNDRLVLRGGDIISLYTVASSNYDLYFSFIDQNWS